IRLTVSSKKRSVKVSGSSAIARRKISIARSRLFSPRAASANCAQLVTMASRAVWDCSAPAPVLRNLCRAEMRAVGSSIARALSIEPGGGVDCACAEEQIGAQINAHINIYLAQIGLGSIRWVLIRSFASLETAIVGVGE